MSNTFEDISIHAITRGYTKEISLFNLLLGNVRNKYNVSLIASCSYQGQVLVWDKKLRSLHNTIKQNAIVYCILLLNESWMVTGNEAGEVSLFRIGQYQPTKQWQEHKGSVSCLTKVSDNLFASSGLDGRVVMYNYETLEVTGKTSVTNRSVTNLTRIDENNLLAGIQSTRDIYYVHFDGKMFKDVTSVVNYNVIRGGYGSTTGLRYFMGKVYNSYDNGTFRTLEFTVGKSVNPATIVEAKFEQSVDGFTMIDEHTILATCFDEYVWIFDTNTGATVNKFKVFCRVMEAIWIGDNKVIFCGMKGGIGILDIKNGSVVTLFSGHNSTIPRMSLVSYN